MSALTDLPFALSLAAPAMALLLEATLLLGGAWAVAHRLRSASAAARHFTWALAGVGLLALPLTALDRPAWRLEIPLPVVARAKPVEPAAPSVAAAPAPLRITDEARIAVPSVPVGAEPAAIPAKPRGRAVTALALLSLAWAAGVAWRLARLAVAARAAHRLRREGRAMNDAELLPLRDELGITRRVALVECAGIAVPMTLGAWRPAVLVPSGFETWDAPRRRAVLLHELAHVSRHDWLLQCLMQMAASLFWFHPLAHVAARRLREEAEQAADDLVLAQGTKASAYAAHLLGLVRELRHPRESTAMAVSMFGGPFDGRIRALLDAARPRGPVSRRLRAGLLAATVASLGVFWSVDVTAAPESHAAMDHVRAALRHVSRLGTPDSGPEWFERGMSHHRSGEYQDAIAAFRTALEMGYEPGLSAFNIACGHARLGRRDAAMDWLERAAAEGFDVGARMRRDADLASLRGLPRFAELASRHEDRGEIHALLATLHGLRASGETAAAPWYDVALALHFAGRHAEAVEAFERADALEPQRALTLYNLACALAQAGRTADALDALERSAQSGWDDATHAEEDGDLVVLQGEPRFASILAVMEQLRMPVSIQVLGHDIGAGADEWKAAAERHEKYLAAHPGAGGAWFNLGFASLRSGDPARAEEAFAQARELGFRPGTSAYNIACAHALQGETDDAFRWLGQAREDGFDPAGMARGDADLASLRDDPRFEEFAGPAWHERVHDHVRRLLSF